jgi:glycosyltransferase involved in cell wall biosynthesis
VRIVVAVPSLAPEFGGPIAKATSLVDALVRLGHEPRLVGAGRGPTSSVSLRSAGRFHQTPIPVELAPLRAAVSTADVVHVLGFRDPVGTAAARTARREGVPFVFEPVGMFPRSGRSRGIKVLFDRTFGRVMRDAGLVIATSELEADELAAAGIPATRIRIRPNGVMLPPRPDVLDRSSARARLGVPAYVPLVLSLGRVTTKKLLPALVRAVAALDGVHLLVAGPDHGDGALERVRRAAAESHLGPRFHLEPRGLWGSDKWAAYVAADVFCMPSQRENFGTAAAEAAAAALPVVVSAGCGVVEWLPAASTRVISDGDPDALGVALSDMLRPAASTAAHAAAPGVARALSWDRIAEHQLRLYAESLGSS